MNLFLIILTVLGLSLFEIISSVDNAIINAEVLKTMGQKARKWFLSWGIIFAVFIVRGLLPWGIVWGTMPQLGPIGALTATFSNNPKIAKSIEESSGILLMLGGTFLIFLFLHWLFIEPKNYGLKAERFFHAQGAWFFAIASIILTLIVWFGLKQNSALAFGAILGSTAFFITHGFKQYAEQEEKHLIVNSTEKHAPVKGIKSDISKVLYLEVIDATFSIDGVVGAFAFTFSVPLIFLGNSIGAIVLRNLTISNIDRVKKYKYLKNGAMYSILFLGLVMLSEGFGVKMPAGISPVLTIGIISYFFMKSRAELK